MKDSFSKTDDSNLLSVVLTSMILFLFIFGLSKL